MNDPYRRRSPDGFDDDAIFADIVAHLNDVPAETQETQETRETRKTEETEAAARAGAEEASTELQAPDQASSDPGDETAQETAPEPGRLPSAEEPRGDLDDRSVRQPAKPATDDDQGADPPAQLWRARDVDDDVEEHFEPPPATPLPAGDLQFWAIIAGMGGGPLLLLYLVFFNREASSYWILTAIAMSVAGFALLVVRMPGHHEDDDDGARL